MNSGVTFTINAETAEAAAKVGEFFRGAGEGFERLSGMGEFLSGIGGKIAAAFSIGAVVEFTREAINSAEAMGKLAQKTGQSIQELDGLRKQAHALGIPFEELQVSLGMFSDKVYAAVRVGGQASQVFRDLGIYLRDPNGQLKAVGVVLSEVAEKFRNMPDGPAKTAAAMELFGRSGRELIPILNQGAEGMERMRTEGGGITPEAVASAHEFNVGVRELTEAFEELFREFAARILPTLKELVAWLQGTNEGVKGTARAAEGLTTAFNGLAIEAVGLGAAVNTLGMVIGSELAAKVGIVVDAFETWLRLMREMLGVVRDLSAAWQLLQAEMVRGALMAKAAATMNWGEVIAQGRLAMGEVTGIGKALGTQMAAHTRNILGEYVGLAHRSVNAVEGVWADLLPRLQAKWAAVANFISRIGGGRTAAVSGGEKAAPGAGSGTGTAPALGASLEAEQFLKETERAHAEATQSRLALLNTEVQQQLAKLEQLAKAGEMSEGQHDRARTEILETGTAKRREIEKKAAEEKAGIELTAIQGRRKLVEEDQFQTEEEKRPKLIDLLGRENEALKKNIALTEERMRRGKLSEEAQIANEKQLADLRLRQAKAESEVEGLQAKGSMGGQFALTLVELGNQWGSWASQMAGAFKSVFNGAIASISSGITGLIMGTKSWGQALMQIGTSILTSIVQAIVEMGVRWVATQVMMAIMGKSLVAAGVAASVPLAAAASAVWAAPAVLSATATAGATAEAAPAEILAAQGITLAGSLGQFLEGGFTGAGARTDVAGLVHRGEFVFEAPAVDAIGVENLQAMREGARGSGGIGRPASATVNNAIGIAFLNDRSEVPAWARSQRGEAHIVDVVRRNAHRLQ